MHHCHHSYIQDGNNYTIVHSPSPLKPTTSAPLPACHSLIHPNRPQDLYNYLISTYLNQHQSIRTRPLSPPPDPPPYTTLHHPTGSKTSTGEKRVAKLKRLLQKQLQPAYLHTLKFLLAHLDRVGQRAGENLMSASNLAVVLCPTLGRDMDKLCLEYLITHHRRVFD